MLVLAVVWAFLVCISSAGAANPADIYPDNKVDWLDLKAMGENWLSGGNTRADINHNGVVNGVDFAALANHWGWVGTLPPDGMVFVYIDDPGVSGHEGFNGYMSKYETTNAQYCQFLNAALDSGDVIVDSNIVYGANGSNGGADFVDEVYLRTFAFTLGSQITFDGNNFSVLSRDGYDMSNHPVVMVSWYGATAFCNYYDYRLPTEWEWQAVADYDGSYIYGCGITIDHNKANYDYDNPLVLSYEPYTSPVNYYPPYGYGMHDMAGNVWEWASNCYNAGCALYFRVSRGGGCHDEESDSTVSTRGMVGWNHEYIDLGFRVCR